MRFPTLPAPPSLPALSLSLPPSSHAPAAARAKAEGARPLLPQAAHAFAHAFAHVFLLTLLLTPLLTPLVSGCSRCTRWCSTTPPPPRRASQSEAWRFKPVTDVTARPARARRRTATHRRGRLRKAAAREGSVFYEWLRVICKAVCFTEGCVCYGRLRMLWKAVYVTYY